MQSMMEYKGYHASFAYDAGAKFFVGEVFGIADSLNFHGTSVEELEAMFHQSIDNYLDICQQIGKEPEKEYKGSFNVRVSATLHREVALAAAKQHKSLNQYTIEALQAALNPTEERNILLVNISKSGDLKLPNTVAATFVEKQYKATELETTYTHKRRSLQC